MFNKIISKFLIISMLIAVFAQVPSYAAEDYYTSDVIEESNYNSGLLSALNIYREETPDVSQQVSRAEFAEIISKLSSRGNDMTASAGKSRFSDVEADNEYYPYIVNTVESGWLQASGNLFYPESAVSSSDVLSALTNMLGYNNIYKNSNMSNVARSIGLIDGVEQNLESPITYGVLSVILTNTLEAKYLDTTDGASYQLSKNTVLDEWFDVMESEGILTAASPTDLYRTGAVRSGDIRIDDVAYKSKKNYSEYLGMRIKYYYDDDSNLIFARPAGSTNSEKVIYAEDLYDFANQQYEYSTDDSGKTKKAKIDHDCYIVYNNSPVSEIDKSMLLPKNGYIRLIDNDRDGKADVLFIMDYKIIDINAIDKNEYAVYDKNSLANKLELKDAYDNGTLYVSDSRGFDIEFEDLIVGDVIIAYVSQDSETATIELLSNIVSGTVNGYSKDNFEIKIDDTAYKTGNGFDYTDIKTSLIIKAYLDDRGKVVYFREQTKPETQYGYMIRCVCTDELEEKIYVKMLNTDSNIVNLTSAKSVSVNGKSYKDQKKAYNAITANGKESQLVRYELNETGELRKIYTANGTNDPEEFRISFEKKSRQYISAQRSFYGSFSLTGDTLVFRVPNDDVTDYDSYGVFRRGWLENAKNYDVEAYNFGEGDLVPNAVIIYEAAKSTRNVYGIVSDCGTKLTDDDEVKHYVTVIQQWETKTYYTDDETLIDNIDIGDFVKCSYGTKDTVYGIECFYDYSESTYLKGNNNPSNSFAIGDRLAFGSVYEKQGTVIGISFDEISSATERSAIETCETSIFRMYKMDETLRKPLPVQASIDDIKDYKHFGNECSKVLVVTNGENPVMMVVY